MGGKGYPRPIPSYSYLGLRGMIYSRVYSTQWGLARDRFVLSLQPIVQHCSIGKFDGGVTSSLKLLDIV